MNDRARFPDTFIPRGTPLPSFSAPMGANEFYHSRVEWCMFFASIYSLQEHPGMNRENATPKTIHECAKLADLMLAEYVVRLKDGVQ